MSKEVRIILIVIITLLFIGLAIWATRLNYDILDEQENEGYESVSYKILSREYTAVDFEKVMIFHTLEEYNDFSMHLANSGNRVRIAEYDKEFFDNNSLAVINIILPNITDELTINAIRDSNIVKVFYEITRGGMSLPAVDQVLVAIEIEKNDTIMVISNMFSIGPSWYEELGGRGAYVSEQEDIWRCLIVVGGRTSLFRIAVESLNIDSEGNIEVIVRETISEADHLSQMRRPSYVSSY